VVLRKMAKYLSAIFLKTILAMVPFAVGAATAQSSTNHYTYDALGRIVAASAQGGPADGSSAVYRYDQAGNRSRVITVASASSSAWSYCAGENGACALPGATGEQWQVRYGTDPYWSYQIFSLTTPSQSITCNNDTFGDPISGTIKHCDRRLIATAWQACSSENETCILSGTAGQKWDIQYGADPNWSSSQYITLASGNATLGCDNATFGDPYPGTVKRCRKRRLP